MKLVIVKMESGKNLFQVPEDRNIKAGSMLMLNTSRGRQIGIAMCDSYVAEGDALEAIYKAFNTYESKMKFVIGAYEPRNWGGEDV